MRDTVKRVAQTGKSFLWMQGVQVDISWSGGNFWRGRTGGKAIDHRTKDQIGMLYDYELHLCIWFSTNAGMKAQILTPFGAGSTNQKLFQKDRANKCFWAGEWWVFCRRSSHPYFSTDTGIALRADEMVTDCILLAKPNWQRIRQRSFESEAKM